MVHRGPVPDRRSGRTKTTLGIYQASAGIAIKNVGRQGRRRVRRMTLRRLVEQGPDEALPVCAVSDPKQDRQAAKDFATTNTLAWLRDNLSSGSAGRRWPGDEEFRQAWLHYNVYSVRKRCKLILDALETSYGHKEPAALDAATIEHVMPQTLTQQWRNMLAENGDPDKVHVLLVDTIGNLTLTAYNSELSNLGFQEKKELYATSNYSLNGCFAAYLVWNAEQIEDRASKLWNEQRKYGRLLFRCRYQLNNDSYRRSRPSVLQRARKRG